ncbi:MAG: hypothetical protein CL857_04750 [Cryomorphaceae bacterium]|nr:hypothetical protein [Cryomorphaceae bacterium]
MKIFLSVVAVILSSALRAQIPENVNENNELINSNNTLNEVEVKKNESLDSVQQFKTLNMVPPSEGNRNGKVSDAFPKQRGYTSQSIQSSQFIDMEYKQSRRQTNSRMISSQSQKRMELELEKIETDEAASFEYNLYNYMLGNYNPAKEAYLNRAEAIRPNDQRVLLQKTANECVKGDTVSTKHYLNKLKSNQTLDVETLDYTEDILASSKGNDILITHGIKDSYGVLYHQLNGSASDEKLLLVSLDLLRSSEYRDILRQKGVLFPSLNQIDTDYFKKFCTLNSEKKIAISLTLPIDYLKRISSYAVPYGLVLITGAQKELCLSDLEKLWTSELNKRNLTIHKSTQAKNYAKNYAPSQKLLDRYEAKKLGAPYISAPNKLEPNRNKKVISDEH